MFCLFLQNKFIYTDLYTLYLLYEVSIILIPEVYIWQMYKNKTTYHPWCEKKEQSLKQNTTK